VLKTKTNLYYYKLCCGISYFQNYNAISTPPPSIPDNPKTTGIVSFHTDTNSSDMDTVLKIPPSSDSLQKTQAVHFSDTVAYPEIFFGAGGFNKFS
jgi:hypothetical protein